MNRLKKLTYIQYIICGLLVIFILGILLSGHAKNVSFETVQQNIVSCEGINTLKKGTARDMRKNLDLDESLFDWSIYYCGNGLMDVSELLIVKSDNSAALETAEKAVASRLDAQKTNFDGYGTNQIDLLGHAITKKSALIIFMLFLSMHQRGRRFYGSRQIDPESTLWYSVV